MDKMFLMATRQEFKLPIKVTSYHYYEINFTDISVVVFAGTQVKWLTSEV
jgi:hypothetical protein